MAHTMTCRLGLPHLLWLALASLDPLYPQVRLQVWSWQYALKPKMAPHYQTLFMGPFGIRASGDASVEPKFETQPRDRFPEFT